MRTKKEILNHIVYVGKQNLPQGGRLILYGSQARGTATDASDWDLLIILDKPKSSRAITTMCHSRLRFSVGISAS